MKIQMTTIRKGWKKGWKWLQLEKVTKKKHFTNKFMKKIYNFNQNFSNLWKWLKKWIWMKFMKMSSNLFELNNIFPKKNIYY